MQASPVVRPHVNPTPPPPRVNRANTPKLGTSPQPLPFWKLKFVLDSLFNLPAKKKKEERPQRWSTGEMSKYVPFLHSEASHPLPFYPIGTIFALNWSWHNWSWHYGLHEDVIGFMWVALCANWQGWKPKVTTKTLGRWLCKGKQHLLAYFPN